MEALKGYWLFKNGFKWEAGKIFQAIFPELKNVDKISSPAIGMLAYTEEKCMA